VSAAASKIWAGLERQEAEERRRRGGEAEWRWEMEVTEEVRGQQLGARCEDEWVTVGGWGVLWAVPYGKRRAWRMDEGVRSQ